LNSASEQVASFHPEDLLLQRRKAIELQAALQALRVHLETHGRLLEEKEGIVDALETLEAQLLHDKGRQDELKGRIVPEAFAILKQARESLQLGEAAVSEHAVVLRQALLPGEACPVCGSHEHPNAAGENSPQRAVLEALKRDVDAKEGAHQKLQAELTGMEVRLDERKKQEQKLRRDLAGLETQLKALAGLQSEAVEVTAILKKPEPQRIPALQQAESATSELLQALDRTDAARIQAEKMLKAARADCDQKGAALKTAETAVAEARSANLAADTEHHSALAELSGLEAEHASAVETVRTVLDSLREAARREQFDYEVSATEYLGWFEKGAREWMAAGQQLEATRQAEAAKADQVPLLQDALETARIALATRVTEQQTAHQNLAAKKATRAALLGGHAVVDAETAMAAEAESAGGAEVLAAGVHAEAKDRHNTNYGLLEDATKRVSILEAEVQAASAAVDEWLGAFGAREGRTIVRSELDEWLGRDADWLEREQRALREAAQLLSTAQGTEATLSGEHAAHLERRSTEEDMATVSSETVRLTTEVRAAGNAVDARRAAVLGDDEKKRQTGDLLQVLEERHKLWDPWCKLSSLIGSADGTRFRNIAQQWTLEILLRHANAQLTLLSGRYRLERLRDSLNLLVTDLEMDGQQRSVHSLSGGESFLVSLGLALGLASLTSSRLLIESLFIDEGFGSLDSETLRVALNALSHLESQGRKVGVISHVSEMVDAIPVQVRVVRGPGGASRIAV
jgi:exonuclease SbcC